MKVSNIASLESDTFLSACVFAEGEEVVIRKSQELMYATTDLFATMHVLISRFSGKSFEEAEEPIVTFVTEALNESCKLLKEIRFFNGKEKIVMERLLLVKLVAFIKESLRILESSFLNTDIPEPESIRNIKQTLTTTERNSQRHSLKQEFIHNMNGGLTQ